MKYAIKEKLIGERRLPVVVGPIWQGCCTTESYKSATCKSDALVT